MKKTVINISVLTVTGMVMVLSIWGPETLVRYRDKTRLGWIHTRAVADTGEGYRYTLNPNEKLYILSQSLNSQNLPESEQSAITRSQKMEYQEAPGTYAFVVNHRGPSEKEITDKEIYETCNRELALLKVLGILPDTVEEVGADTYDAVLYSAIDVLEPRNHVGVWKLNLSNSRQNAKKGNRLMDVYIDGDDGKIYEFYARTTLDWEDIDPDKIIKSWSSYMGLLDPVPYEVENPLMETTPYFRKYVFSGGGRSSSKSSDGDMGEERTIVTIGFYEGIHELFLKISK